MAISAKEIQEELAQNGEEAGKQRTGKVDVHLQNLIEQPLFMLCVWLDGRLPQLKDAEPCYSRESRTMELAEK